MNSLQNSLTLVKNGIQHVAEKQYDQAKESYTLAMRYLCHVLTSEGEEIIDSVKIEIDQQIKFCLKNLDEIDILAKTEHKNECQEIGNAWNSDDAIIFNKIKSTILCKKPSVKFSDVCGLEKERKLLQAAVILPVRFPDSFANRKSSYRAFLFYGPGGTGKSFIAEAVAGEASQSTYFSVSAADLISRYQGDSENSIKYLFKIARERQPSIIFIDEIDSLMLSRTGSDTDGARRIKTELFIQMQGVSSNNSGVFIMAATNTPHDLDSAFLRRFDKLIYVPLPDTNSRLDMFKKLLLNDDADSPKDIKQEDLEELSRITDGLSGSDIFSICKNAKMVAVAKMQESTYFSKLFDELKQQWVFTPCSSSCAEAEQIELDEIPFGSIVSLPPTTTEDVIKEARKAKPRTTKLQIEKLEKFKKQMENENKNANMLISPLPWYEKTFQGILNFLG